MWSTRNYRGSPKLLQRSSTRNQWQNDIKPIRYSFIMVSLFRMTSTDFQAGRTHFYDSVLPLAKVYKWKEAVLSCRFTILIALHPTGQPAPLGEVFCRVRSQRWHKAQKKFLPSSVASSEPDELAGPVKQPSNPSSVGHSETDELANEAKTPIPRVADVVAPAPAPNSTTGNLKYLAEDIQRITKL